MIITGYPTTAAAQDAFERSWEQEWERLNAPDPAEDKLKEAAESLGAALDNIDSGLDWLADAISKLEGTPMADKIQSFLDSFESLANDLEGIKDHCERGERE